MTTDTPVWDSIDGDTQLSRLQQAWNITRLRADIALAQFGPWEEQTRTRPGKTGRGLDVLIPPQLADSRYRKLSIDELGFS